ncbi:serine protease [Parafrankia soli]|uniref:Serine protease n=1 Tax=Parafrankia soli TaxID=2599596 RepID=A0A1S1QBD1_9ACTN|nr:CAP domain-containing protein [Parafrankia soli]OHV32148.1 serine protease [Parafrankia soli]
MAPVRKTVASAAATVALLAAVASCRPAPGGPPGGGFPVPTASTSTSPTATPTSSAPTTVTPPPSTPTAAPTTTAPTPPAPTTAPPSTRPPRPTDPPGPTDPPVPTNPPVTSAPPAPPGTSPQADEVVRLTNVEREKAGCGPLAVDTRLTAAAQAHTADMAANDYFSHDGQDGSSPGDRTRAAGFPSGFVGENIAAGSTTPAATLQMWMNSSGHRANILNCGYTHIGVGYAQGGSYRYYWTQDFGKL